MTSQLPIEWLQPWDCVGSVPLLQPSCLAIRSRSRSRPGLARGTPATAARAESADVPGALSNPPPSDEQQQAAKCEQAGPDRGRFSVW